MTAGVWSTNDFLIIVEKKKQQNLDKWTKGLFMLEILVGTIYKNEQNEHLFLIYEMWNKMCTAVLVKVGLNLLLSFLFIWYHDLSREIRSAHVVFFKKSDM